MKPLDILILVTAAWAKGSDIADADAMNGQYNKANMNWALVTNNTNVVVYVKTGPKTSPTANGRAILPGDSFEYRHLNTAFAFFKAASAPTGVITITGYIDA